MGAMAVTEKNSAKASPVLADVYGHCSILEQKKKNSSKESGGADNGPEGRVLSPASRAGTRGCRAASARKGNAARVSGGAGGRSGVPGIERGTAAKTKLPQASPLWHKSSRAAMLNMSTTVPSSLKRAGNTATVQSVEKAENENALTTLPAYEVGEEVIFFDQKKSDPAIVGTIRKAFRHKDGRASYHIQVDNDGQSPSKSLVLVPEKNIQAKAEQPPCGPPLVDYVCRSPQPKPGSRPLPNFEPKPTSTFRFNDDVVGFLKEHKSISIEKDLAVGNYGAHQKTSATKKQMSCILGPNCLRYRAKNNLFGVSEQPLGTAI